ncbi:MAG: hypothetical protein KBD15_02870, partial [Candidatus Magasanikbacteria bacterium]|nr:hypothetical protein [Candidatus Magasanikbacteria bacterium]
FGLSYIPNDGVGLARLEFIFSNFIRIHPLALVHYNRLKDKKAKKQIDLLTTGYKKKTDYCVDKLAEGIARIAAASYKNDVIVRLSDFKTNEYATMIGGKEFEPKEENPMLGWRGASRYYSKEYKEAFRLECQAIKKVRDEWGLTNVIVMVPFCRTPEEGKKVLETMAEFGLKQGDNGLQVYVMCEIPSNVILAEEFAKIFDGFSIGSNDLTQLTLGLDRDTGNLMHIGDATNPAVKKLIQDVIRVAHAHKKKIGICGQAPSDSPEFAEFLVREGIDSISLNPDTIIETRTRIAAVEKTLGKKGKKTHAGYLSIVAAFGIFAAGLMGLGAGCGSLQPQEDVGSYIAPAVIREKIEEKKQAEEKDGVYTSTLTDTSFDAFTLKYPANWQVAHFEQGVSISNSMIDGGGLRYMSIYTQVQPVTSDTSTYETISVDGYTAQKIRSKDTITQQELLFIIIERAGDRLIIEGTADVVERMLPTFQFLDGPPDAASPTVIQQWGKPETVMCAQVMTYAKQSESATCEVFPTPCDVPSGWVQCDMSEPVLAL